MRVAAIGFAFSVATISAPLIAQSEQEAVETCELFMATIDRHLDEIGPAILNLEAMRDASTGADRIVLQDAITGIMNSWTAMHNVAVAELEKCHSAKR